VRVWADNAENKTDSGLML